MTKIPLKINRHYGNNDLRIIIENYISIMLTNLKFTSKENDKSYDNSIALHQEAGNSE